MLTEIDVASGVRERAVRFPSGGETLVGVLALPAVPPPLEGGGKGEGYQPRIEGCALPPQPSPSGEERCQSHIEGRAPPPQPSPSGGEGDHARGVVIVHGWGSSRTGPHDMLVKLARSLASRGIPALRFDFRGRGESTGAVMETDLDAMIDDAVVAAAFLKEEAGVTEVEAVGLCSGANVALAAAAHEGAFGKVAALSVLPFQSHKSAMQELRRTGGMFRKVFAKALNPVTWWRLVTGRVRVFRVLKTLFGGEGGKVKTASGETRNLKDSPRDLMGALAKFKGKLLFVWGGADPEGMGAKAHFEEFAQANDLDARFEVVEGSNHNYYSLEWEREVFEVVEVFLVEGGGE